MKTEEWQRIEELFCVAADLSPGEQETYLAKECGDNDALRRAVERLLASDRQDDAVARAVGDGLDLLTHEELRASSLGPYRVLERLGYGGMGMVYLAERADQEYHKRVAIKIIRPGLDQERIFERFRRERQILANLEHPHIARLLDGGSTPDGRPYLVMEYVEGLPIDQDADRRHLDIEDRLRLFRTVCSAVQYAHQRLVIHRDLKPSNILVTHDGTVKLLDFGIAKLLAPDGETVPDIELTMTSERPLTLSYASPEQVTGEAITTASDVYSLGVLLYRLLTGRPPLDLRGLARREAEQRILDETPPLPSTAVGRGKEAGAVARRRRSRSETLARRLRGDLDNIVLRALAKDPRRRYGSAIELSEDVQRYLLGLPVVAHGDSLAYRSLKFVRRNRISLLVAAAFVAILVTAWVARTQQAERVARERDKAQRVVAFLVELFEISDPSQSRGESITARELLDEGAVRISRELEDQPLVRAMLSDTIGRVYRQLGLYEQAGSLLEEALKIRQRRLGSSDPEIAQSLNHLGNLRRAEGDYEQAEKLARQAVDMLKSSSETPTAQLAESINDLALALQNLGRYDEAEQLLQRALALYHELYGERHESLAATLSNLALVRGAQSDFDAAERLARQSLQVAREVFGEPHPEVARYLNNLAFLLESRGHYAAALPLYRDALAMRREVLGDRHPDLIQSLNNLASLAFLQGDYAKAEPLFREALDRSRQILGASHPEITAALNNLAVVRQVRGDYEEAESLFREALEVRRSALGEDHPDVAQSLDNLAALLFTKRQYEEAAPLYEKALEVRLELLGKSHPDVALSFTNLAKLERVRHRLPAAIQHQERACDILQQVFGDEHPRVARSRADLAELKVAAGDHEAAEILYRRAIEEQHRQLGAEHPDLAGSLTGLGRILTQRGVMAEAEAVLRQARSIRRQTLPPGHWRTAETESVLGSCLAAQGHLTEAEHLLSQGFQILATARGDDHYLTLEAHDRLQRFTEAQRTPSP